MSACPYCKSRVHQNRAGRTRAGSQRFRCNTCQRRYTPVPKSHGYPVDVVRKAWWLHAEGNSARQIARNLHISPQTVLCWLSSSHQEGPHLEGEGTVHRVLR